MNAGFGFVAQRLERAAEHRDDPGFLARAWADGGRAIAVDPRGRVLVSTNAEALATLTAREHGRVPGSEGPGVFLGLLEARAWFAVPLAAEDAAPVPDARLADLRALVASLPGEAAALAAYARALLHWQTRKRHCGVCGAPTRLAAAGHKASCEAPGCGAEYFPRTDPAIIVLVADGARCLLGRQPTWPERRYSTLAGFVEPGETLEAAIAREVREETGVAVGTARYVASQPWPFPASLMLGFEAEARRPVDPIAVGLELADARWFEAGEVIARSASHDLLLPPETSISFHLIADWCERLAGARPTPGPGLAPPR